jgi:hypothetical protein
MQYGQNVRGSCSCKYSIREHSSRVSSVEPYTGHRYVILLNIVPGRRCGTVASKNLNRGSNYSVLS